MPASLDEEAGTKLPPLRSSPRNESALSSNSNNSFTSESIILEETPTVYLKDGELDKKYECPVCFKILRYPLQFDECSHNVCSACLAELLRVVPRCPIDHVQIDRNRVLVNKPLQKEINALEVLCYQKQRGCKWNGIYKELSDHNEKCRYADVLCPQACGIRFERRFLEKHTKSDCVKRLVACEFCSKMVQYDKELDHLNDCASFPVSCPNRCNTKDIRREDLESHMANDCLKAGVPCAFSRFGCKHQSERNEMKKHEEDEVVKHLSLLCTSLGAAIDDAKFQEEKFMQFSTQFHESESRVKTLEKYYGAQLVWKIDKFSEQQKKAKIGEKPTIFSPPFLTSRHGYKLALSTCLNGDGSAKGKWMSLFICICKGDFDALNEWPFSHKVTFTLIDQNEDANNRRNVNYVVRPNAVKENKPFLGRPLGPRNASFGAQKFIELHMLEKYDYIRDDVMFVKVHVDMDDINPI